MSSKKADRITVEELGPQQYQAFQGMVKEMAESMEHIKYQQSFQKDVKARCQDELGVSGGELNRVAKIAFDEAAALKKLRQAQEEYDMARKLGFAHEDND